MHHERDLSTPANERPHEPAIPSVHDRPKPLAVGPVVSKGPGTMPLFPAIARGTLERIIEQIDVDLSEVQQRVILVTAPQQGDGATTVAWWLLSLLATSRQGDVLYFDASMQAGETPTVDAKTSEMEEPADGVPRVVPTEAAGIYSLEALDSNSGRGPALQSIARTLAQLRERFSWIVIDAPPPSCFSPRSVFLVQHADAILLVLAAGRTDRNQAIDTVELIRRSGGRVIGALLNKTQS